MKLIRGLFARIAPIVALTALFIAAPFHEALAQVAPPLGTTQNFAVLGGSTVTNTGPTVITGDLGLDPGTAITGFPPGTVVGGTIQATDAVALQAQTDNTTAYNALAAEGCTVNVSTDLGGQTLPPGVYCFSSSAGLTGTLTLDAMGNPSAVWVFKIGSTLTTASSSSVVLVNGAQQCNVFWQVGSSATLGTGSTFVGNIFALASITIGTSATVSGSALAQTGAVTLDSNTVAVSVCAVQSAPIPPTIGKAFNLATISAGGSSTLTITLSNSDTAAATLTAPLTDTFPSGVLASGSASSTCGVTPTVTTISGVTTVTLGTGASIPADASCTVTVPVTASSGGNYINSLLASALQTSNGSNAAPAVATLTVTALAPVAPTLGKAFSPSTIAAGGSSTLTITLSNADTAVATLTAPLTDTFPSGVLASGSASSTCGATPTVTTISDVTTLTLGTGASIPAGASCTVTVPVTASSGGNYINSLLAGALQTSNGSNAAPAVATLTVTAPALIAPTLGKAFSPPTISMGGSSTLTITLSNADTAAATLTAPLIDTFPSGVLASGSPSSTCGVTPTVTTTSGVTTVTLGTGASIPVGGSCTVTVPVTAPSGGNYINSLPAGALVTSNGSNATSAIATLTVSTPSSVTVGKSFSPATIYAGGISTLTITFSNAGATAASLNVPFTDTLPSGVLIAGSVSSTCIPPLTGFNVQRPTKQPRFETIAFRMPTRMLAWLDTGTSSVTITGGSIPAGGSCTLTVPVTAPVAGIYFNAVPAGALQTSNGNNAAPVVATLTVLPVSVPPSLSKSFSPAAIYAGGLSTLTITLINPNNTIANLTAPLTDTLPSGVLIAGSVSSTCIPPLTGFNMQRPSRQPRFETIAFRMPTRMLAWLSTGSSSVSITGGSIPASSSCTVTVPVTAAVVGSYINTLPVGALQTNLGSNTNTGAATLVVGTVAATVGPATSATIAVGSSANFTVSLTSTNGASGLVSFDCSGLAAALSCTFNPPQVTVPSSGSVATTLTVAVNATPASLHNGPRDFWPNPSAPRMVLAALFFLMIPVITFYRRKDVRLVVLTRWLAAVALALVLATVLVSCGGALSAPGTSGTTGATTSVSNSVTTQFTLQAQSGSATVNLSTLTVTVP